MTLMIDLHSHILPGMDDGSKNPEESAVLLRMLQQQGVTTLAATPHFYARETPEAFLKRRQEAMAHLPRLEDGPNLLLGAEVAYFSGMGNCEELIPLQIGNTKLLLVEMPFQDWTERMIEDICDIPVQLGLIPVLAHINRYTGKRQFPKFKDLLMQAGVLFQCNAEAFLSFFGKRWALEQLGSGYVHFLGSDCHNVDRRPPMLSQANTAIEKKFGKVFLRNFYKSGADLLKNE